MFVTTCVAGMITMATLNNKPKVIKTRTTTSAPNPINGMTPMSSNAMTATTTTPTTLLLCTDDPTVYKRTRS